MQELDLLLTRIEEDQQRTMLKDRTVVLFRTLVCVSVFLKQNLLIASDFFSDCIEQMFSPSLVMKTWEGVKSKLQKEDAHYYSSAGEVESNERQS